MDKTHLKSPKNWINDPNGFIYYKGKYHLFYQHFPYAPVWGRMHWGHAVSSDLVNWEHKDIAVYPSKAEDRSGCFSGSAVEKDGKLYLFYTGVSYKEENPENINCPAEGDGFISSQLLLISEDGESFDNLSNKKTVIPPVNDSSIGSETNTRDPKVWKGRDAWYMILGSSANNTGRFLFYKSHDLENWEYANFFEKEDLGWMWECPDYFEINGNGAVIFSPIGILDDGKAYDSASVCAAASFDEEKCEMKISGTCMMPDYGIDLYAPQSTVDEYGNRTLIAWARMPEPVNGNSIGMMCIPRLVEIKSGHIFFRPHPNIKKAFSVQTEKPDHRKNYMIKKSLKNNESLNIGGYLITRKNDRIITDRSAVFAGHTDYRLTAQTPVITGGNELEIYVDSNLIEIYVNDGEYVLTSVVYGISDSITGSGYTLYCTE